MENYRQYLQPDVIAKISSIELQAKLIVEGFLTGLHKSPYHGFSIEFSEYRQYNEGDNLRYIDWKKFAKTEKYYIKRFEEETNLRAYIFLDVSNSMNYRSEHAPVSKMQYASCLVASLSLLFQKQRDAVGLVTFHSSIDASFSPSVKAGQQTLIWKELVRNLHREKSSSESKFHETNIQEALRMYISQIYRSSIAIVISDFLEPPEKVIPLLKLLRHKQNEVIVFRVLDPAEKNLSFEGDKEFMDMETGERITTIPLQIKKAYQEAFQKNEATYRQTLLNHRIDYMQIDTTQPFDIALQTYFKKRSKLM